MTWVIHIEKPTPDRDGLVIVRDKASGAVVATMTPLEADRIGQGLSMASQAATRPTERNNVKQIGLMAMAIFGNPRKKRERE